jgi:hypothetical protein
MNFTESFSEFSSKLRPQDLALYAGVGIVLWVLFKDKLSPVQKLVSEFINKFVNNKNSSVVTKPVEVEAVNSTTNKDLFFDLVVSWKQTRDLAAKSNCTKAVEVADQMFPYLSPMVCIDPTKEEKK